MNTIIPVLMSDINQLANPVDKIKYCLWVYFHLPKNINDTFNQQEISFRWDDADVGSSKDLLAGRAKSALENILRRYFPDASVVDATVTTTDIDEVRYSISVDILVVINEVSYSISNNFEVNPDKTLKYILQGE